MSLAVKPVSFLLCTKNLFPDWASIRSAILLASKFRPTRDGEVEDKPSNANLLLEFEESKPKEKPEITVVKKMYDVTQLLITNYRPKDFCL